MKKLFFFVMVILALTSIACAQSGGVWLNFDGTLKTGFKVGKNGGELKYNAATKAYYLKVPKNGGGYDSLYIVLSSWAAGPNNLDINVSQSVFADSLAAIRNKINLKASTNVVNRQGDSLATAYAQILLESGIRDSVDGELWASLTLKVSANDVYSLLQILPDSVKIQSNNIILDGSVIADSLLYGKTISLQNLYTIDATNWIGLSTGNIFFNNFHSGSTTSKALSRNGNGTELLWDGSTVVTAGNISSYALTSEVDGSTTNELQTLGTSGNTITLTNGGSVTAPYATTAGSVSNITGGGANQILYQSAANTTAFVSSPPATNTVLTYTGVNTFGYTGFISSNTANSLVYRDSNGDFSAGSISATSLSGALTTSGITIYNNDVSYITKTLDINSSGTLLFDGSTLAAWGSTGNSGAFVAGSSGGSPTTQLTYVAVTINGNTYNLLVKP